MAKKRKIELPKKVAGVKVPKAVRTGRVGAFLTSPLGRTLMAEALVAAGAIAGARQAARSPKGRRVLDKAAKRLGEAKAAAVDSRLAYALSEAARSFTDALHRHDADHPAPTRPQAAKKPPAEAPATFEAGPL